MKVTRQVEFTMLVTVVRDLAADPCVIAVSSSCQLRTSRIPTRHHKGGIHSKGVQPLSIATQAMHREPDGIASADVRNHGNRAIRKRRRTLHVR